MASEAAYANPGTDPYASSYRRREFPDYPSVSSAEEIAAPMDLAVFRVWVDGTPHRLREAQRISAWTEYQAVTAKPERPTAEEMPLQLPAEIETSITELVNLPQGWDGYDGLPVRPEVAEHARRFMTTIRECTQLVPAIVPLSDGGLQLEWFVDAYEVEVVIAPDGTAYVHFECTSDGRIEEFDLSGSFDTEKIAPFFRELRR